MRNARDHLQENSKIKQIWLYWFRATNGVDKDARSTQNPAAD